MSLGIHLKAVVGEHISQLFSVRLHDAAVHKVKIVCQQHPDAPLSSMGLSSSKMD